MLAERARKRGKVPHPLSVCMIILTLRFGESGVGRHSIGFSNQTSWRAALRGLLDMVRARGVAQNFRAAACGRHSSSAAAVAAPASAETAPPAPATGGRRAARRKHKRDRR